MAKIQKVSTPGRPTFKHPAPGKGYGNAKAAPKPTGKADRSTASGPGLSYFFKR